MKSDKRVVVLEEMLNKGSITEVEQDEFFALLESEHKLDSWLDSGVRINPDNEVVYSDKKFLKEIAEPIEFLKPDNSITYQNKRSIYRKGEAAFLTKNVKIAISIAAVILIGFVITFPKTTYLNENDTTIALNELENNLKYKIASKKNIEIKKIFEYAVFKPILDELSPKIIIKNSKLKYIPKIAHIEVKNPVVKNIRENTADIKHEQINEPVQDDIMLFAQAEVWTDVEPKQQEDIVVNHDVWQPNREKRRGKIRNALKNIKNHII